MEKKRAQNLSRDFWKLFEECSHKSAKTNCMNFDIATLLCRSRNLLFMFERQCESVLSISTLFNEKASIVAVNMYVKLKVALYI